MRISDWSSDVCSSDLSCDHGLFLLACALADLGLEQECVLGRDDLARLETRHDLDATGAALADGDLLGPEAVVRPHEDHIAAFEGLKRLIGDNDPGGTARLGTTAREEPHADRKAKSEEHTSELQSLMRISYAVFCLKKKK